MRSHTIMPDNIVQKVLREHLVGGDLRAGQPITYRIDQVLLQDATGTMAWMEFEQLEVDRVKVPLVVQYVDHNMIQLDYKNPEDHFFLQGMAARYGAVFSRPGNGICHYVHLERFAKPYATLVGSDSHTTTAGAVGSFALGIGGMDAAVAMAGFPFELQCPAVVRVVLENELPPWVSAKDVILEMLRRLTVKGGVNKAFEFDGPGVATLSATERALELRGHGHPRRHGEGEGGAPRSGHDCLPRVEADPHDHRRVRGSRRLHRGRGPDPRARVRPLRRHGTGPARGRPQRQDDEP